MVEQRLQHTCVVYLLPLYTDPVGDLVPVDPDLFLITPRLGWRSTACNITLPSLPPPHGQDVHLPLLPLPPYRPTPPHLPIPWLDILSTYCWTPPALLTWPSPA